MISVRTDIAENGASADLDRGVVLAAKQICRVHILEECEDIIIVSLKQVCSIDDPCEFFGREVECHVSQAIRLGGHTGMDHRTLQPINVTVLIQVELSVGGLTIRGELLREDATRLTEEIGEGVVFHVVQHRLGCISTVALLNGLVPDDSLGLGPGSIAPQVDVDWEVLRISVAEIVQDVEMLQGIARREVVRCSVERATPAEGVLLDCQSGTLDVDQGHIVTLDKAIIEPILSDIQSAV